MNNVTGSAADRAHNAARLRAGAAACALVLGKAAYVTLGPDGAVHARLRRPWWRFLFPVVWFWLADARARAVCADRVTRLIGWCPEVICE